MNNDVFEKYSIPKVVASMALPTILGLLVTVFYNIAGTYFIGQYKADECSTVTGV